MSKSLSNEKGKLYQPQGKFMLRTPLLTMEDFLKLSDSKDNVELLRSYFENPIIKEAIYIASKDLYLALEKKRVEVQGEKEAFFSFLKYLLRMSTRATPFGLFSSVSIGQFEATTSIELSQINHIKKRLRPDMEWLFNIIQGLEKELNVVKNLRVIFNPLNVKSANRLVLESRESEKNSKKKKTSIRTSYLTDYIFELAQKPIIFQSLIDATREKFPHLDGEKISYLIWNLFEQQFLISELAPSLLVMNPFHQFLQKISHSLPEMPILSSLREINHLIEKYNQTLPGEGLMLLQELLPAMQQIKEAPHMIQVDSALHEEKLQLSHQVAFELTESLEFLWKVSSKKEAKHLEKFHRLFLDKYGTDELIPVQQLIDGSSGIGLSEWEENEIAQENELQIYLKQRVQEVFLKGEKELELTDELPFLSPRSSQEFIEASPSIEVFCEVLTPSQISLDEGNFFIILNGISGAGQSGGTFGRFTDILKEKGENLIKDIFQKEETLEPHVSNVEASYLPSLPRLANVAIHPNHRKNVINLNFPSEEESALDLDDIYVGANLDRLYLVSKKLNRELNITASNMLNPSFAPTALKLLRDITKYKYKAIPFWDWGSLRDFPYLPRLRFKKTIISPARWKIHLDMLNVKDQKDEKVISSRLSTWIQDWEVPRFVYLTFLDNKILLDLNHVSHLEQIAHELKTKKSVLLTEHIDIEGNRWIKSPQGSHACEFVIPMIRNPLYKQERKLSYSTHFESIPVHQKYQLPGGEWLYVKIFLPHDRQDEFIVQQLAPFAQSILEQNIADYWFYIRYQEQEYGHHIRLRFHGKANEILAQLLPQLHAWGSKLLEEKRITTLEIGSYEREVYRYGGPNLIEYAEKIFASDSIACALLLSNYTEQKYKIPLYALAALNVIDLLFHLGFSLEKQIEFLESLNIDKKYLEGFKLSSQILIKMSQWVFKEEKPLQSSIDHEWLTCLQIRQFYLSQFKAQIEIESQSKIIHSSTIYQSLIHMHCNRLMGVDAEKEKKALAHALHTLLRLKHLSTLSSDVHIPKQPQECF